MFGQADVERANSGGTLAVDAVWLQQAGGGSAS